MKTRTVLMVLLPLILGVAVFYFMNNDPCDNLDPCEQYKCRNPEFYCVRTLYESHTRPQSIEDAQKIVLHYVSNELGLSAEIITSSQWQDASPWYQITCRLSDGSEYGYEVAPDGNIYEIKHLN